MSSRKVKTLMRQIPQMLDEAEARGRRNGITSMLGGELGLRLQGQGFDIDCVMKPTSIDHRVGLNDVVLTDLNAICVGVRK